MEFMGDDELFSRGQIVVMGFDIIFSSPLSVGRAKTDGLMSKSNTPI